LDDLAELRREFSAMSDSMRERPATDYEASQEKLWQDVKEAVRSAVRAELDRRES